MKHHKKDVYMLGCWGILSNAPCLFISLIGYVLCRLTPPHVTLLGPADHLALAFVLITGLGLVVSFLMAVTYKKA